MRLFLYGMIFGVFATFFGLFIGLQVSNILGTILVFPVILVSMIIDLPLGMMSANQRITSLVIACVSWGLVFVLARALWRWFNVRTGNYNF